MPYVIVIAIIICLLCVEFTPENNDFQCYYPKKPKLHLNC